MYNKFNPKSKSLIEDHQEYFNLSEEEKLEAEQINKEQHFLIVTDGTDLKTRKAINYWKDSGLKIDSIVYRIYVTNSGEQLIELGTYSPYQDVIEQESSNYLLNTNYRNNPADHKDMLENGKAAAFYSPWKEKIQRIEKGDKVFLYQSGKGIVEIGIGTGNVQMQDYNGHTNEEYFMKLQDFKLLNKPLRAKKIKDITETNYRFSPTMFSIGYHRGNKVWDYIIK